MAASFLILIGAIIGVGFIGQLFFEKTRLPSVLLLIAVGIVIGPVFGVVRPEELRGFMPLFGAVALAIILFEGGLDLDIGLAVRQAGRSILLALISFASAAFLVYHAIVVALGRTGPEAIALAAALACTSAPIVIPIVASIAAKSPMRPLLIVESALSDALAVMAVLALLDLHEGGLSGFLVAGEVGRSLAIGLGAALAGGALWLWLLSHLASRPYFYLMTIGFVFFLVGIVEFFHGSGAIAALGFGMTLANGGRLVEKLTPRWREAVQMTLGGGGMQPHAKITESHAELSFVTRSFFFVYLGIIFEWPGNDLALWLAIALAFLAIVVGREISVQLVGWMTGIAAPNRKLLAAMLPRGLATAVLASLIPSGQNGESGTWATLATFVILLTNLWMTIQLKKATRGTAFGTAASAAVFVAAALAAGIAGTPGAACAESTTVVADSTVAAPVDSTVAPDSSTAVDSASADSTSAPAVAMTRMSDLREEELLLRLLLGIVYPIALLVILRLARFAVLRWERAWRTPVAGWVERLAVRGGVEERAPLGRRVVRLLAGIERIAVFGAIALAFSLVWFALFPQTRPLAIAIVRVVLDPLAAVAGGVLRGGFTLAYSALVVLAAVRFTPRLALLPRVFTWVGAVLLLVLPYPGVPRLFGAGVLLLFLLFALLAARPLIEEIAAGLYVNAHFALREGAEVVIGDVRGRIVARHPAHLEIRVNEGDALVAIPYTRILRADGITLAKRS